MSKRYPGGVIRKTPATPTQSSASGVWNMTDVTQAQQTNNWPVANVPNPMSRSLRFRASAGAFLSRNFQATGVNKATFSFWVKRGTLSTVNYFWNDTANGFYAYFKSDNTFVTYGGADLSTFAELFTTTAVFRDPSAWYHFVVSLDASNATQSNRIKVWVNGVQQSGTFSGSGYNTSTAGIPFFTDSGQKTFGANSGVGNADYYLSELNVVQDQALAATSFGQYDQFSNWTSKKYTGTYGNNGFYLPFSNNSSTGTLGLDFSGNNNTWTTNNFSVTAGATYDSMTDVPTQWTPYNVTGDVGGVIRGNYCVMNPLFVGQSTISSGFGGNPNTISNGNLKVSIGSGGVAQAGSIGNFGVTTGKWYFEVTAGAVSTGDDLIGCIQTFNGGNSFNGYRSNGVIYNQGSATSGYATWTAGDVIGMALDCGAGTLACYKNGTLIATISITGGVVAPMFPLIWMRDNTNSPYYFANFGQYAFAYAPPSGYKSLCTTNLPTPTIQQGNLVMDATTYTGNGGTLSVTNTASFKPDFVWAKSRSNTNYHNLMDSVRGTNKDLYSNSTAAEETNAQIFTALNSNGFSVGTDNSANQSGQTFVGWQWQAGQGTTSSNTSGTITSTVSVNPTAGFSIVSYTGNGSAGATVGHGLGVAPALIIAKKRSSTGSWQVYSNAIPNMTTGYITLNGGSGFDTGTSTIWNNTSPTSTVFTLGTDTDANANGATTIAYCWAEVAGYSKSLAWTGNGSTDGPFVYCGFSPAFILIKRTNATTDWVLIDNKRLGYNVTDVALNPNATYAENSGYATDFTANGFKLRTTTGYMNASGGTYIGFAFASYPFKSALAR